MCTEIEYAMILEMLQKRQKEQKKIEKPIEVLSHWIIKFQR